MKFLLNIQIGKNYSLRNRNVGKDYEVEQKNMWYTIAMA